MLTTKCLGNMTIPANRQVSGQRFIDGRERNRGPLDGHAFRVKQSRLVIDYFYFSKWPVAELALLTAIPFHEYAAHETLDRRNVELQQTLLAAVFIQRPAPTVF